MTQLLIRHARILSTEGEFLLGDILIEQGKISEIAEAISETSYSNIIDATGLTLLPGVIDPQVHFREPGLEYKEDLFTATCACAKGGSHFILRNAQYAPSNDYSRSIRSQITVGCPEMFGELWFFYRCNP